MIEDSNVKVLIPARSGSKGIHKKNIKPLLGKPLVDYTIQEALKLVSKENIFLSSDGKDILRRGIEFGIKTTVRPKEISSDSSTSDELITHFIEDTKLPDNSVIIYLQPTSPLRNARHISAAYAIYRQQEQGTVLSVALSKQLPSKSLELDSDNHLKPIIHTDNKFTNRQEIPATFYPNGAIYIFKSNLFMEQKTIPEPKIPYLMNYYESIDIDDDLDFRIVEILMRNENEL